MVNIIVRDNALLFMVLVRTIYTEGLIKTVIFSLQEKSLSPSRLWIIIQNS